MNELGWNDLTANGTLDRPAALTIGVFDGLHLGHRGLIASVTAKTELVPVVVTFAQHPTEVLAPDRFPGLIMSRAQKRSGLADQGVAVAVLIDFTPEFALTSGAAFLDTLIRAFRPGFAAIGHDFRCGHEMSMDAEAVRAHFDQSGIRVTRLDAVKCGGTIVSSTRIRMLVREGMLTDAAELLGQPFSLDVSGEQLAGSSGETRIALSDRGLLRASRQVVPPPGEYRSILVSDRGEQEAVISVTENSVLLPLAVDSRIRYIVLQEKRV